MNSHRPSRNVIPVQHNINRACLLILLSVTLTFGIRATATAEDEANTVQADQDVTRYTVNNQSSWLRVLVYRAGLLGGFGHNHVISLDQINGAVFVARDLSSSSLMLRFALADLRIDEPELRRSQGPDFAKEVADKDRAGTRANLLGDKLLQAEQFPEIQIRSNSVSGSLPQLEIEATVVVRGLENTLVFPVTVEFDENSLAASGEIDIQHTDIGLEPFRAFLNTIKVADNIVLQYRIQATAVPHH